MMLSLSLLLAGLFSPLVWFLAGISGLAMLLSIALIGAGLYYARRALLHLQRITFEYKYHVPTYKRLSREHYKRPASAE
jgi:hypothetical protein